MTGRRAKERCRPEHSLPFLCGSALADQLKLRAQTEHSLPFLGSSGPKFGNRGAARSRGASSSCRHQPANPRVNVRKMTLSRVLENPFTYLCSR